jgi:hypothetical protein
MSILRVKKNKIGHIFAEGYGDSDMVGPKFKVEQATSEFTNPFTFLPSSLLKRHNFRFWKNNQETSNLVFWAPFTPRAPS